MEILYSHCCAACIITPKGKELKTFGTFTNNLFGLANWITGKGYTHVAMESIGVYRKPIYNILDIRLEGDPAGQRPAHQGCSRPQDIIIFIWHLAVFIIDNSFYPFTLMPLLTANSTVRAVWLIVPSPALATTTMSNPNSKIKWYN